MKQTPATLALATLLTLLTLLTHATTAIAQTAPKIDVVTMGAGEHPFTKFGHACICVTDDARPGGICYNYGTTDFERPVGLSAEVLRDEAVFWVSTRSLEGVVALYRREDRTVYIQRLPLPPDDARSLAAALAESALPENRNYVYDHFDDNCATRIRDLIEATLPGSMSREAGALYGGTFRDMVRPAFSSSLLYTTLSEVGLGRPMEEAPTVWEAMFLPDVLRAELETRFHAAPRTLYARKAPPVGDDEGALLDLWLLVASLGLLLGLTAALGTLRGKRWALAVTACALSAAGLFLWTLAIAATVDELVYNEALLVLVPLDLLLVALSDRGRLAYLALRIGALAAVAVLAGAGVGLVQPLLPIIALVALSYAPTLGILLAQRLSERAHGFSEKNRIIFGHKTAQKP